jgi:hypothetical protein
MSPGETTLGFVSAAKGEQGDRLRRPDGARGASDF